MLIGELPTFYLHHSKHKITSFIAWMHDTESKAACPNVVEEIIRVPHKQLLDSNQKKWKNGLLVIKFMMCPFTKCTEFIYGEQLL